MERRLTVDIEEIQDISHVHLSGFIDEENSLAKVSEKIKGKVVVINTAGVKRINSCGVRDWVRWVEKLGQRGSQVYFTECSTSIMSQVNTTKNFTGSGRIISFFTPYFCTNCSEERDLLLDMNDVVSQGKARAPHRRCSTCDHVLEFNDAEIFYFSFFSWMKAPHEQDIKRVAAAIHGSTKIGSKPDTRDMLELAAATTKSVDPQGTSSVSGDTTSSNTGKPVETSASLGDLLDAFPQQHVKNTRKILYLIISLFVATILIVICALTMRS